MKKLLWLDDFRNPVDFVSGDYEIIWIKNYENFCLYIEENGLPDIICFDHDLGEEMTGSDAAKYVVNYCQQHKCNIPEYHVQSSNVVGKGNIEGIMEAWRRFYENNYKTK